VSKISTQLPPITLPYHKNTAAFSTRSHGLRKIMLTDYKLGVKRCSESSLARHAFDESNPFDDPEAQNCMAYIDAENRYLDSSYVWIKEAAIVDRELSKLVEAAGKKVRQSRHLDHIETRLTPSRQNGLLR
jgi:hypothetical protein